MEQDGNHAEREARPGRDQRDHVNDFDPDTANIPERTKEFEPKRGPRPESGYIGLQNHDDYDQGKAHVYFKEVSVKSL